MCECIKNIEEDVERDLRSQKNVDEILEDAEMENKAVIFAEGGLKSRLYYIVAAMYSSGKLTRLYKKKMTADYCPFCGRKY
jgi:hypothetical protein